MACKHDFVRVSSKWITEEFVLWHRCCLSVSSPGLLYYKQVYTVVRRERDHNWNKPVSTADDRAWCPNTVLSGHQSEHTLLATTQVKIQARYRCPSTGSELEFCCFNVGTSSLLHTFPGNSEDIHYFEYPRRLLCSCFKMASVDSAKRKKFIQSVI